MNSMVCVPMILRSGMPVVNCPISLAKACIQIGALTDRTKCRYSKLDPVVGQVTACADGMAAICAAYVTGVLHLR